MLPNCLKTAVLVVFFLPAAAGGAQRTFVSAGSGSDSNLCTRALPCRNFAAAISQTDAGGEVVVLDSGGYGVVAISQSVALIAAGASTAAITASRETQSSGSRFDRRGMRRGLYPPRNGRESTGSPFTGGGGRRYPSRNAPQWDV